MAELSRGQILKNPEVLGAGTTGASIRLLDADENSHIDLKVPDTVGIAYTLTLPASDGNPGDVLISTDGNGNLTFSGVPAAGSDTQITYNNEGVNAGSAVTTNGNDFYFEAGSGIIFKDNVDLYSKIQHSASADISDANNLIYNLPTDTPTSGEVLKVLSTSAAGGNNTVNLHWATDETATGATAAIGGDRAIQFSDAGFLGGDQNFTFQSDNTVELIGNLFVGDPITPDDINVGIATFLTRVAIGTNVDNTNGQEIPLVIFHRSDVGNALNIVGDELLNSGGVLSFGHDYSENGVYVSASGTGVPLFIGSGGDIIFSPSITLGDLYLNLNKSFRFYNASNTNFGGIKFNDPTVDYTITLPGTDGIQDDILQRDGSGNMQWVDNRRVVNAVFYGGSNPIGSGSTIILSVPNDCTIIESRLIAGESDSMTVVVERATFATTPTWTDISNGGQALSGAVAVSNTTLTGWTVTLNRGDLLRFRVTSAPTNAINATCSLMLRSR